MGTYTIVLTADPTTASGVQCGVSPRVTSNNADVALDTDISPLTKRLAFGGTNWSTPQTVTVTAAGDADGVDDAATLSHSRVGGRCAGDFFGAPTLPSVDVTVNDDETPGIVLDADPSTGNMDESGPLALTEGHATDAGKSVTVRLAAEPTQDVTVTLASADTGAMTVDDTDSVAPSVQDTLTFTTTDWNTAQTVTAQVRALRVQWGAVTGADGYKVQWRSGQQGYATDREDRYGHEPHRGRLDGGYAVHGARRAHAHGRERRPGLGG